MVREHVMRMWTKDITVSLFHVLYLTMCLVVWIFLNAFCLFVENVRGRHYSILWTVGTMYPVVEFG